MDRIELFKVFARVVESGSFTKAATTLGLPRSSISAAIQTLEGRVGARLLSRTTRKVAPTQDGHAFYERCLRAIADVEEIENLFRDDGVLPSGRIRIDVPGRIGRLIADAMPGPIASILEPGELEAIRQRLLQLPEPGARAGLGKLTQCGKITVGFAGPRRIISVRMFETGGEHGGTEAIVKPGADPAERGAAQSVEYAADHHGKRNDQRQHHKRIGAAARQHAIVDLQQIDRWRQKQQVVAAAISKDEHERTCASPQGLLERRLRLRTPLQP